MYTSSSESPETNTIPLPVLFHGGETESEPSLTTPLSPCSPQLIDRLRYIDEIEAKHMQIDAPRSPSPTVSDFTPGDADMQAQALTALFNPEEYLMFSDDDDNEYSPLPRYPRIQERLLTFRTTFLSTGIQEAPTAPLATLPDCQRTCHG
ncbi:hypothetical protein HGRIS_001281 [Hohenbuehelia grisea]|uniref:Uncharacterized protein n=1 Tax=Hohenbuehelia grisea TaxID=104357 RepID=A0ABR3JQE1_9AGAR